MCKIIVTCLLIALTSVCEADCRYTLSVCAIFQDEGPYLKEWIDFHKRVGVEHFYLYNHRSGDGYREVLQPYIDAGEVELFEVSEVAETIDQFNPLQSGCYTECLERARGVTKWVAFLDVDEYLFSPGGGNVKALLADYEPYGGVCVNWQLFGTSGVAKVPQGKLMVEVLTRCAVEAYPANFHIKSIVRPERATRFLNPHHPEYREGFYQVNTDKIPFEGRFSPYIRINKLRINHYWTRDEAFFYGVKIPRQRRWGGTPDPDKLLRDMNAVTDTTILIPSPKG